VNGPAAFAHAWADRVAGTSYVSMTRAESRRFLRVLTERLAAALAAETFDAAAVYQVGTDLFDAGYTAPEALGRTVALMHERLLTDLGRTDPDGRLGRLIDVLASSCARAQLDRTLDAQDDMRRAAMVARIRAERALHESEARSLHAALHDPLTGLPNRTLFARHVADALARDDRVGVCFVGLDRFKAVNDSLGHAVGNRLLVAVAQRLSALGERLFVARLGGDEFAVHVPATTCVDDVLKVADRILATLAAPVLVDGRELSVSASAGLVERPTAGTDAGDVLRAADISLHWAKADGRNRCAAFDPDRNATDVARFTLAAAMPGALARDEFYPVYQPLVDLERRTLVGVEALALWRHPVHGRLSAGSFIGLAEDSGLIVPLGLRLMELACEQAKRWMGPFVSVNLAVRQIRRPGLVGEVAALLDRVGLPPALLQLEITESAVLDPDDETLGTLRALDALGIRLVIDDFGTGYANLAYLADLPVRGLKVAAAFLRPEPVGQPGNEARRAAVLEAMVSTGRALGLTVTAEGIETPEQARTLRAMGCHLGQGWYLGRPVDADAVPVS
jgi:diguanylate cyclase (GGDEF)-like protein